MTPVLVFDGDCAFCSTSARFVSERLRRSPADYAVEPWQHLDLDALGLTPAECDAAVRWVSADGIPDAGHVAIARALRASRWWARPVGRRAAGTGDQLGGGAGLHLGVGQPAPPARRHPRLLPVTRVKIDH